MAQSVEHATAAPNAPGLSLVFPPLFSLKVGTCVSGKKFDACDITIACASVVNRDNH